MCPPFSVGGVLGPTRPVHNVFLPHPGEHRSHFKPFVDNARMTWLHTRLTFGAFFRALPFPRKPTPGAP
jgi:hypothetical protein